MVAGGHAHPELARLARVVLAVHAERAHAFGVERLDADLAVVEEEPELEGFRGGRPLAARHHPEDVVRLDGEPVDGVERVRKAQARRVVLRGDRRAGLDLGPHGGQAHEAGLRRIRAEERCSRDALRGEEVLLEERGRERQDVAVVVEAVARVVLGEVVGGPEVHAEEVAHAVVVLGAVQPPRGDAAGVGRGEGVRAGERRLDPLDDGLPLLLADGGEPGRGHHPRAHLLDDLLPDGGVGRNRSRRAVGGEVQVRVLHELVVALVAGAGEDGLDRRVEGRGGEG